MEKARLDQELVKRGFLSSRSQAGSYIRLGKVTVNGREVSKPGFLVYEHDKISLKAPEKYVSRAGFKLASVAEALKLNFKDTVVLDVGSSTGGFTDYALQHGAKKVVAVDVGTFQLHQSLRGDPRIELHEKTDIRDVRSQISELRSQNLEPRTQISIETPDIVVIDVSFISLREILPHISSLMSPNSILAAMVKPQFEAGKAQVSKGVIKNDTVRRQILKDFEAWAKQYFIIIDKADSQVAGATGNRERFYLLQTVS